MKNIINLRQKIRSGGILFMLCWTLFLYNSGKAQNITKIEYFFDADPGNGNGVDLPFSPAPQLSNLNYTIPVTSLAEGFHQLYIRSRDENMRWSITSVRPFYKVSLTGALPDIANLEYFIDTDPGTGNGTNVPVTPGNNLNNLLVNIDAAGLTSGFHSLCFRAKDAAGKWSFTNVRTFYKGSVPGNPPDVTRLEYFIDTDPGIGQAMNVPVTPGANLTNLAFAVDLMCLSHGQHYLYVRSLDSFGKWSLTNLQTMTYAGPAIVVSGPTNICPGQSVQLDAPSGQGRTYQWHRNNVPISGSTGSGYIATETGNYYVKISVEGSCTDTSNMVAVTVNPNSPVPTIAGAAAVCNGATGVTYATESGKTEYVWNVSSGGSVTGGGGTNTIQVSWNSAGAQSVSVNYSNGSCSAAVPTVKDVAVNPVLPVSVSIIASSNPVIAGSNVTFTATPLNGGSSPGYQWKINGNNVGLSIATYSYIPQDNDMVTCVVTSGLTCATNNPAASNAITMMVNNLPVANAGIDQTIPSGQMVTLNGSGSYDVNGDPLTYSWIAPPGIVLSDPSAVNPTFFAIVSCATHSYTFTLVVSDGQFNALPDQVTITALHLPTLITVSPLSFTESLASGTATTKVLKVKNEGQCGLTFNLSASAAWLVPTPNFSAIAAGDSVQFAIHINGTNLYAGTYNATITLSSSDPDQPAVVVPVSLTVTGEPSMIVMPASLNYGVIFIGQSENHTLTISNTGNANLHITDIASSHPEFTASDPAVTIPPAQSYNLIVTYHPATSGNANGSLTFSANDPNQAMATISLAGQGLPAPVISVFPGSLQDTLEPSQVSMQQLKIHNNGASSLVFSLSENASWLNVWPLAGTIAQGDCTMIDVSYNANLSTTCYTNIKITSNDPVVSLIYIPVSMTVVTPLWVETTATPQKICVGSNAQLSALPHGGYAGLNYLWSSNPPGFSSMLQNPVVSPTITTHYTVTVSDGHSAATSQTQVTVYLNQSPTPVSNMLPVNNATGLQLPVLLSWSPSVNCAAYDVYIWRYNDPKPATPLGLNIMQISYLFTEGGMISYGDSCKWQVVAKNPCYQTSGPIQVFYIKGLPNLHVTSVANSQPLAGQPITITWTVKNDGEGATPAGTIWLDRVWISPDIDFRIGEPEAILLGQFPNVSYLAPGESYTHTQQVQMPANLIGNYFLMVVTDDLDACFINFPPSGPPLPFTPPPYYLSTAHGGSTVTESVEHDNFFYKEMLFPVPPVPDLQVTSVVGPANVFSGQLVNLTWTVKNQGDGNTGVNTWSDRVWFSPDTLFNPVTAVNLGTFGHTGMLNPDSSYTQTKTVSIPAGIYGARFFFVTTDVENNVFEYLYENNNRRKSDTVHVFLTPPPDLVVTSLTVPDTISNNDLFNITWTVGNQGANAPTVLTWNDVVYLSPSPDYNLSNAICLGSNTRYGTLAPDSLYTVPKTINMYRNITGQYYVYVHTDAGNDVFEFNSENNNILRSDTSIFIITPDLTISGITVPPLNNNSQPVEIQWVVKNIGPGKVFHQNWKDKIMASKSPVYHPDSMVVLGEMSYSDITMMRNATISRNKVVIIPDSLSGSCYIYIHTDWQHTVYENGLEANNIVICSEPVVMLKPDLAISDITIPVMDTTGQPINISWKITNAGVGVVDYRNWTDRIMLSCSPVYSPETAFPLDTLNYDASLSPGMSLLKEKIVSLPDSIPGPFYIFILADCNDDIFENLSEANNIGRSPATLQRLRPDLIVEDLIIPASAVWGDSIMVHWVTKNSGPIAIIDKSRTDRVTISNQPAYQAAGEVLLGNLPVVETLHSGDTVQHHLAVTLPDGIQGTWYIHVYVDVTNNIAEGVHENNNTTAAAMQINTGLWADLQAMSMGVADSAVAGTNFPVNYSVKNTGTRALHNKTWSDKIYLSNLPVWSPATVTWLRTLYRSDELVSNAVYSDNSSVNLPSNLQTGHYYLYVFTDADSAIFENTGENNNVLRSAPVIINAMPPVDLVVTSVVSPDSANSNQPVMVEWTVINTANTQTLFSWDDAIYLSADSTFNPGSDILLGKRLHYGAILPGNSYSGSLTVGIPNGMNGDYYLLAVADYNQANNDENLLNNYRSRTNAANVMQPIHITLTPPPDLTVTSLLSPTQVFTGKPFKVAWAVGNNGNGVTVPDSWTDRLYLSTDFTVNSGDLLLDSKNHSNALGVNQTYTDSVQVTLPNNLSGNYIVLAATDCSDAIYEINENNNAKYAFLAVPQPPPADLAVSAVNPPSAVLSGEVAVVAWTLKNKGQNSAGGNIKDMVYFSKDPFWDINDVLFGSFQSLVTLSPGSTISRSISARVNNLPVGYYYAIVKTDVLNGIYETNENNNVSASSVNFFADVRVLPLGVLTSDTLVNFENLYFRIPVADTLYNETMLTILKADSITGMNEMYQKYKYMPTRISYDYSSGNPYRGNQEIIASSVSHGNNYLLLYGNTMAGEEQKVSLLATIMNFSIRSVDPPEGGNTGEVTLKITGSKFDSGVTVRLQQGETALIAKSILFSDYSKMFATFDLRGIQPGPYSVIVEKRDGSAVSLPDGFEVVPGTQTNLSIHIVAPPSARPNRVTSFTIEFANQGNTNLANPAITVESLTSSPIALNVEQLSGLMHKLVVHLSEENGPPDILRPGVTGFLTVYTKTTAGPGYIIKYGEN